MRSALSFLLPALLLTGCGDDTRLEASPREIKADGTSSAQITFYDDHDDGIEVSFETDLGNFVDAGSETQYASRSLAGGRATIELFSDIYPGVATVTATTDYGQASVTVRFTQLRPSGGAMSLDCDAVNLGALREPVPDLATPCHLRLRDRTGTPVDPRGLAGGELGFLAEAGILRPEIVDDGYGDVYYLYTAQGGETAPFDVEPITGEPSRAGDTGGTRNPRDGLVTIVAWVRGEEGFHDINGNGVYDPMSGETFTDQGEPFVDVNDDGEFDAGDGDTFLDLDGNLSYTPPNGSFDEDTIVWTSFKLLWTGPLHESSSTSRVELSPCGREIPSGTTCDVVVTLVDQNINPVAAVESDTVTISSSSSYGSLTDYYFSLSNTRGFEIDEQGAVLGNRFSPLQVSTRLTNSNTYTEPDPLTITVEGAVTPAPRRSDGSYPETYQLSLEGLDATLLGLPE